MVMVMSKLSVDVCVVAGYGWSGSGAVIDMLKEIETVRSFDVEYRAIKDPYGLIDLERALTENWDLLNSDFALRNFIKLSEMHGNKNAKYTKYRMSYGEKINKNFKEFTDIYVESLIQCKLKFTWWQRYIHLTWFQNIWGKFIARLNLLPTGYLTITDKSEFLEKTTLYLERLFDLGNEQLVVLDQAVSPNNISGGLKYFKNSRMIIVDRNPFDVLADLRVNMALMGKKDVRNSVEAFVAFYKESRSRLSQPLPVCVKVIMFEDLVNHYVTVRSDIIDFIGMDESENLATFSIFDPKKSAKNIGIYKEHLSTDEIAQISLMLDCQPPA